MMRLIKSERYEQNNIVFDISFISEQGGRPVNEDSLLIQHSDEHILLSVADGLGAHGGGDIASQTACEIIEKEYQKITKPNSKNICKLFQEVDDAIVDKQTDELKMKTTLACVLFRNKYIYAAHIGDTRIYTFKNDSKVYLTVDHSVAYEEVMKNHGTLDDIRTNPNRHILKAALGVGKIRPPDTFKQKIKTNLSMLICSDGFWEFVNEDEMLETLANTKTSHEWLEQMLKLHSEKVDNYNDNYSAICLRIIKN